MEFTREFIEIGNIQIRYYGIIIVAAMLVATVIAANLAKRSGRDPEHIYGALTWAIIPGIIFARLWFITFPPELQVEQGLDRAFYYSNFFDLNNGGIAIWSGGLSIFGAVLGGLLGTLIYLRRNNLPIGPWLDLGAIVLPLAQGIGRWANYVNRELYGIPTNVSWWGLEIPIDERPEQYRAIEFFDAKFHPLFLYEFLWNVGAFFVLLYLWNRNRDRFKPGDFFLIYVAQYSFVRFMLEFIRVEVSLVGGVNLAQIVTGIAFVVAVAALFVRHSGNFAVVKGQYPEATDPEKPQARQQTKQDEAKPARNRQPVPAGAAAGGGNTSPPDSPIDDAAGATAVTAVSPADATDKKQGATAATEAKAADSGGSNDASDSDSGGSDD